MKEWVESKLLNGWVEYDKKKDDSNQISCVICSGKTDFEPSEKLSLVCGKHLSELVGLWESTKNHQLGVIKDGKIAFIFPKEIHMSESEDK